MRNYEQINRPRKNIIKFFIDFYRSVKIPWWLYIVTSVLGILSAELTVQVSKQLISVNKGELYNSVILGYVILTIINTFVSFGTNLATGYADNKIVYRLRLKLWKKLLHLPSKNVDEEQPSTMISAVTAEASEASDVIRTLFSCVSSIYGLVRACIELYQVNSEISLYMILLIPLAVFVFFIVGKIEFVVKRKQYAAINAMTSYFSEHISAAKFVKAHSLQKEEIKGGEKAIKQRLFADIYYTIMIQVEVILFQLYSKITTIIIAVRGSELIGQGKMESTGITDFTAYMDNVNRYIAENLTHYQVCTGAKGTLAHIDRLSDIKGEDLDAGAEWTDGEKNIVFKNVTFGYTDINILNDVSFEIPTGKTTAIIGDNGSGKSTALKLMQGLYNTNDGEIYVAGNKTGEVKLKALRSRFAYVIQSSPLFSDTLRENICYGGNYTDEEIITACKDAKIDDFVISSENGLDTEIYDGGVNLSGGQRQRVALARAILKKPEFLLLDEAGANLDRETYSEIRKNIKSTLPDTTVIFTSHDADEIRSADYVIVLSGGKVEACGTPAELENTSKTYMDYLKAEGGKELTV